VRLYCNLSIVHKIRNRPQLTKLTITLSDLPSPIEILSDVKLKPLQSFANFNFWELLTNFFELHNYEENKNQLGLLNYGDEHISGV